MYLAFFGLAERPFSITPDPRYLYLGAHHADALAHLLYGINGAGGFIQLTGEVGTGKTTTIRSLLARTPAGADIALVINPRLSALEFLQTICEELGIEIPARGMANARTLVGLLNRHLLATHAAGRRAVLIVDEAQNLTVDVLEQLRLLTNLETATQKLLQIILIGQPELRTLLDRTDLRQLAQRITARYHLQPLAGDETAAYVRHRLRIAGATRELFRPAALRAVHRLSGGVPRLINVICDRALLGSYTEDRREITAALVRRAAAEVLGRRLGPGWRAPALAASCLLLLLLGAALAWQRWAPWYHPVRARAPAAAVPARAGSPTATLPARAPTLEQVLAQAGASSSADSAFAGLLGLWGANYAPGAGGPCAQAAAQGLYCVTLHSSLAQLRELGRPAILLLGGEGAGGQQVVLTGIGEDRVMLRIGERSANVAIAELAQRWYGDCVLLWRPGAAAVAELRPGMHGPAVRTLRTQLLRASGTEPAMAPSASFDPELTQLVEDFQRAHHLTVDGIVGIETQLLLDAVLAAPGSPVLQSLSAAPAPASGARPG
jgi:general secretion pathway protein A